MRLPKTRRYVSRLSSDLSIAQILAWADEWFEANGKWPGAKSGRIPRTNEKWANIDQNLRDRGRGLPYRTTLARLLQRERGHRNLGNLPRLTIKQILAWADEWFAKNGKWPGAKSGRIPETSENWGTIDQHLRGGGRGFPYRTTLARFLAERRGVRNHGDLPHFREEEILVWADAYRQRHGKWPNQQSGPIPEAPGESWGKVDRALISGLRGCPGGSSLPQLLERHRGHRNHMNLPDLTIQQILSWADAHHRRTGRWPRHKSGPILEQPDTTWSAVDTALNEGCRGLRGGSSLTQLLEKHRGADRRRERPRWTVQQVLEWADSHYRRTGVWPTWRSGRIPEAKWETWRLVDYALKRRRQRLSLAQLLAKHRGADNAQSDGKKSRFPSVT